MCHVQGAEMQVSRVNLVDSAEKSETEHPGFKSLFMGNVVLLGGVSIFSSW